MAANDPSGPDETKPIPAPTRSHPDRMGALARRLAEADSAALGAVIESGLAELGASAGADRVFYFTTRQSGVQTNRIHTWSRAGFEPVAPEVDSDALRRYGWYVPRMLRGELIRVARVGDLPPAARGEADSMRARGVRSALGIPVVTAESLQAFLSFEYLRAERDWSADEIESLKLVAALFTGAIRRQAAEDALALQLQAERQIAELARRFVQLGEEELDAGIRDGLGTAARLAGADRCSLLARWHADGLPHTWDWCAPGVPARSAVEVFEADGELFVAIESLLDQDVLHVPDVEGAGDRALDERLDLSVHGVRSMLGIAIRAGTQIVGFMTFECARTRKRWSEQDVTRLRLLGEVFGSALHRRRHERELATSRMELLQAQKMEAVGRMAGGVAHDFNNLLTVILGSGRLLQGGLAETDPLREEADEVCAAAERAAGLTRQLLSFGRPRLAGARRVDLNAVIRDLESILRRLVGADVALQITLSAERPAIVADPSQIEQVLVNLVINARAALESGGRIELGTACVAIDAERAARLGLDERGDAVILSVRDTGCGMSDSVRDRIFEPFFTTRGPGEGSGLGLSIVYGVVQHCGGHIEVSTQRGVGTRFDLYFARLREVAERPAPTEASGPVTGARILLVEDEDAIRRLARRTLERAGYEVIEARNGREGFELARARAGAIDLLLTDVVMPEMDGAVLARRVHEVQPGLPVLLMSGYPRPGDDALPSVEILQKPFSAPALLERVAQILAGRER